MEAARAAASSARAESNLSGTAPGERTLPSPPRRIQYEPRVRPLYSDAPPPRESVLPAFLRGIGGLFTFFILFVVLAIGTVSLLISRHTPKEASWKVEKGSLRELTPEGRADMVRQGLLPSPDEGVPRAEIQKPTDPFADVPAALRPIVKALEEYAEQSDRYPSSLSPDCGELVVFGDMTAAREALQESRIASYRLIRSPDRTFESFELTARANDAQGTPLVARRTHVYRMPPLSTETGPIRETGSP